MRVPNLSKEIIPLKRTLCVAAFLAVAFAGIVPGRSAHAESDTIVLQARGNPNLIVFLSLAETRGNLRTSMVTMGLDAAFSEWLRHDRPYVYRHFAEDVANR